MQLKLYKYSFSRKCTFIGKFRRKLRFVNNLNSFLKQFSLVYTRHKNKMQFANTENLYISLCNQFDYMSIQERIPKRGIFHGTRANFIHNGTFQQAIAPVLILAQFFCLMPVRGIRSKTAKGLSFSWSSFRTWYCVVYSITTAIDTILTLNKVLHGELDVRNFEPFIFHICTLLASIGFLRLAAKWPELMRKWQNVERQMPKFIKWCDREVLARRIKMVAFVFVTLSLTEHLLSIVSAIHYANFCPIRSDPIESYFYSVSDQIFFIIEYNTWLAWLGKIQNVLMTFGWTYMDIFVSIMGIGLSSLFRRVQMHLDLVQGQPMPEIFWTRSRIQYRAICDLIDEVDAAISGITMLTFANNLYFVCIQLLKSINKMPSVAHAVYFYFSLMFLLARTLAVSLFLAEVNDASVRPLLVMKFVPETAYNDEVVRFSREVATDVIALSGLKFFNVTRKLVLTVAGTIVTYELVLLQFREGQDLWHCGED